MASYYVWSGAAGSANGSSWVNAYTVLLTAMTGRAAGDILYVAHDHAETRATNMILPGVGSASNPVKVICVDRAGTVPPVSADRRATATVTTTGNQEIYFTGYYHFDGIIFNAGTGATAGSVTIALGEGTGLWQRFDNCSLRNNIAGSAVTRIGYSGGNFGNYIELNNTTMSFAHTGARIVMQGGVLRWRNTSSALLGTMPTTLFQVNTLGVSLECIGVDLSAMTSGTLVGSGNTQGGYVRFVDCKLHASVTQSAVPTTHGAPDIDFVRCGSSGVNYTVRRHRISGLLIEETTIVRTGGAVA